MFRRRGNCLQWEGLAHPHPRFVSAMHERPHPQSRRTITRLPTGPATRHAAVLCRRLDSDAPSSVVAVASYIILILGIGTLAATAYLILATYTTVPNGDEWDVLRGYVASHSALPLHWMWAQHNEHRIVFQKLLLAVDLHFFRGYEWPMLLATFLSQLSLFGVLALLLRRIGNLEAWSYRSALGVALYCIFCPSQWENYTWGFQFSFVLVDLFFISALTALLLLAQPLALSRRKRRILLAASVAAGGAATICNGNGLLTWLILIAASLALGLRWPVTAIYALSGVVLAALYFHGYVPPPHHPSPLASLHQPSQIVKYVAKYFGNSFVPNTHLHWSLQLGAVGFTLVCGLTFWVVRNLSARDRTLTIGLLALMGYVFLTACVTALGRINFGTEQALSSRYQSYALLFWFAFALLLMTSLMVRKARKALAAFLLVIVALFATSALWYGSVLEMARDTKFERDLAGFALLAGVHDDKLMEDTIWSSPPMLWSVAAYFREHGLSIFATQKARAINQPLTAVYKVKPSNWCLGGINLVRSFSESSGGLRVEGWAVDRKSRRPLNGVVMVNDGLITGYGVSGSPPSDVADSLQSESDQDSGWIGFVEPGANGGTIEVYGILDGLEYDWVCEIGQVASPGTAQGKHASVGNENVI